MSFTGKLVVTFVLGFAAVTTAQAEELNCAVTAIAFDENLNPLAIQEVREGTLQSRNPAKACGRDRTIATTAAQAACRSNAGARFVALFRRIDGVDLVKSGDSKAKFKGTDLAAETATIKMQSCAFWMM